MYTYIFQNIQKFECCRYMRLKDIMRLRTVFCITDLAWGLSIGNSASQTVNVPKKLILLETSACSRNGSVAAT